MEGADGLSDAWGKLSRICSTLVVLEWTIKAGKPIGGLDALVETSRGMTVVRMKSEGQDTWCLRVATDMVCLSLGDTARGSPRC